MDDAKSKLWDVLNAESRDAVYNVCVVHEYRCEWDGVCQTIITPAHPHPPPL